MLVCRYSDCGWIKVSLSVCQSHHKVCKFSVINCVSGSNASILKLPFFIPLFSQIYYVIIAALDKHSTRIIIAIGNVRFVLYLCLNLPICILRFQQTLSAFDGFSLIFISLFFSFYMTRFAHYSHT